MWHLAVKQATVYIGEWNLGLIACSHGTVERALFSCSLVHNFLVVTWNIRVLFKLPSWAVPLNLLTAYNFPRSQNR